MCSKVLRKNFRFFQWILIVLIYIQKKPITLLMSNVMEHSKPFQWISLKIFIKICYFYRKKKKLTLFRSLKKKKLTMIFIKFPVTSARVINFPKCLIGFNSHFQFSKRSRLIKRKRLKKKKFLQIRSFFQIRKRSRLFNRNSLIKQLTKIQSFHPTFNNNNINIILKKWSLVHQIYIIK